MIRLRHRLSVAAVLLTSQLLFAQAPPAKPAPQATASSKAAAAKPVVAKPVVAKPDKGALIDINTAQPDQLMQLQGIGEAYAKRIVDGRPYTAKTQLVTRGILPQPTYSKVADLIIAKRVAK